MSGCDVPMRDGQPGLSAWKYHVPLRVVERAKARARDFPVSFELDTKRLITEGKLRTDLRDLRMTVAGEEVPFQLERGSSGKTKVTFQIDLGPAQVREDAVLHYGNPRAKKPEYDRTWGVISPSNDAFENELLRISYGLKVSTFRKKWGCQREFTIKKYDEDQFGGRHVPDSWAKNRNDVTYWEPVTEGGPKFEVEIDGPIYKRVKFFAAKRIRQHHPGAEVEHLENLTQRVTFYRNCPFIREDFENIDSAVTTTAVPGGMRLRSGDKRNFDFVAHKLDSDQITWEGIDEDKETRGGFTASKARAEKDPRYRYLGDHAYNDDYLILGVVNIHNSRGIGTCVRRPKTAFFVDWPHQRAGFSVWPDKTRRMMRYLYYVERGRREVTSRGKLLAAPPAVSLLGGPVENVTTGSDKWGRIEIYRDSADQLNVLLENSKILVRYETRVPGDRQTYIREFIIKEAKESQGYWLDAAAWRRGLRRAEILKDAPDVKTVRLTWNGSEKFPTQAISDVSIFPDSSVLRIDCLQSSFAHICDIGSPGGSRYRGKFVIYGSEEWREVREKLDRPELRDHPSEDHRLTNDLFPRFPNPLIDVGWGPSPMNYKGWYIMGTYNPESGRGYGRVVPAKTMRYIKLLSQPMNPGYGFEFFPWWRMRGKSTTPYTAFLYAVTGGEKEILTVGKKIADDAGSAFAPPRRRPH